MLEMEEVVQTLTGILVECLTRSELRKCSDTVALCPTGPPSLRATPAKVKPSTLGRLGAVISSASAPQLITEAIRQLNTSGLRWNECSLIVSDSIGCFILHVQWDRKREHCLSPEEKISTDSEQAPGL